MPRLSMELFNFDKEKENEFKTIGLRSKRKNLYTYDKQVGRTSKKIDSKRSALAPGKRISRTGKVYYESRKNRSDLVGQSI